DGRWRGPPVTAVGSKIARPGVCSVGTAMALTRRAGCWHPRLSAHDVVSSGRRRPPAPAKEWTDGLRSRREAARSVLLWRPLSALGRRRPGHRLLLQHERLPL